MSTLVVAELSIAIPLVPIVYAYRFSPQIAGFVTRSVLLCERGVKGRRALAFALYQSGMAVSLAGEVA
jgi:hypothetical protein